MRREKSLSNGKKLLLILLFSVFTAVFAVGIGNMFRCAEFVTAVYTFVAGGIHFVTFTILLRDYKTEKREKTGIWYTDKYLLGFFPVWILTAIMFCAFGESDDGRLPLIYIGLAMFPIMGIISTPNAVIYAKKDMQNRKVELPPHKNAVLMLILKRIWNTILVIVLVPLLSLVGAALIPAVGSKSIEPGDLFAAVLHVRAVRAEGKMFFMVLFLVTFGIPILAYNITISIIMVKKALRRK